MLDHVASSRGTSRSEVLRRGLAGEGIASLKKERAVILARLAEIEDNRAKLANYDDDVKKAESALQGLANKHSDLIDEWTGKGCNGPSQSRRSSCTRTWKPRTEVHTRRAHQSLADLQLAFEGAIAVSALAVFMFSGTAKGRGSSSLRPAIFFAQSSPSVPNRHDFARYAQ